MKNIVILGAGFGGLELASRLSDSVADEVRVTLIDQNDSFTFGFWKLDILFGGANAADVRIPYRELAKPGVEFRQERITAIDPAARHVTTDGGSYDADILVVALGAEYDVAATPGFAEGGLEYYSIAGAERMRDALPAFAGGTVLIGVLGQPYKCPPAPFEGAFLLHDQLVERGIREQTEIRVVAPMSVPVPVTPQVSQRFLDELAARGIEYMAQNRVVELVPSAKEAVLESGERLPYDLFVGIPIHRVPAVVAESGLAENGWVAVDRGTLMTPFPDVYAVGDVVGLPMAKAGVFAENAAGVVADDIVARLRGETSERRYEGEGNCYIEFGSGRVAKVEANFLGGPSPTRRDRRPVGGSRRRQEDVRPDPARALVRPSSRLASLLVHELPGGTVTFLFTDIEGSTRLLHELGPARYADALAEHRRIVREAATAHGGVEVDTQGDAFFIAFPTPGGAAAAAQAAREGLAAGTIRVRMGLHTGAPTVTEEGYVGEDVHRGARIAALAHGDQILVSPATAALLDSEPLRDVGRHRLKDFEGAVRLYQLGDREFPPLRTPGSVELPTPATPFLGREQELFDAVSLVYERDPRVLTIVGPGGTGKTRFSIELARLLGDDAEGGTIFVPLAPLRDAEFVLPAVADRLGASAADPAAIAARVGQRRTHVVCDNLEQLLPDAARPLAELVAAVPALRLFATSREALRIQGEAELDLPPLVRDEAVALFCERAQAVRPDVTATDAVVQLCDRLDGLPLALELAAARTKLLAPEALLDRLADRLDSLKGTRDAEERHMTLRATIAWSYDLLDEDEQALFASLGVFRGGCTLETAEVVCDADLDTLASLLDKSLLRRRTGRLGEERYWMLETIREFAVERLGESGCEDDLRRRHAERMLQITRAARFGVDDAETDIGLLTSEREDLRSALDWAEEHDAHLGLELAVDLQQLWNTSGPQEGFERIQRLRERAGDISLELRASALRAQGGTADLAGRDDLAIELTQESLELYRQLGDDRGVALVEQMQAVSAWRLEDWNRMRELTEQSMELAEGSFPFIEAANYWLLGQLALHDGDVERAVELTRRGTEMSHAAGWAWWESGQRHELLMLGLRRGDLDEAEQEGHRRARDGARAGEPALGALHACGPGAGRARPRQPRAGGPPLGRRREGGRDPAALARRACPPRRRPRRGRT